MPLTSLFKSAIPLVLFSFAILSVFLPRAACAQAGFHEGFRAGASINVGSIRFERDFDALNDNFSSEAGLQLHALYMQSLNSTFSAETGLTLFSHRYSFFSEQDVTDELGVPTGEIIINETDERIGTSYLSLPLNLIARPFPQRSALGGLYITAGPEVGYKVAHFNGTITARALDERGEEIEDFGIENERLEIPGQSRDVLFFANAGIGYRIHSERFPLNIELRGKHSINRYAEGENRADVWLRKASLMISYRI